MIIELTIEELIDYIEELSDSEAFELSIKDEDILIPYMMNDAVECFLRLSSASLSRPWPADYKGQIRCFYMANGKQEFCLSKDGEERVYISYDKAFFEMHCYQYHRIGHNWRKKKGEEKWRRLVNLLCVLHDKFHYLGEEACNSLECILWPLMEFGPLCYYTPINQSIEEWYPETEEGIMAMKLLSGEAGDHEYEELIAAYVQGKISRIHMAEELIKLEHEKIFVFLQERIDRASVFWPERPYLSAEMYSNLRREKIEEFLALGYVGVYPLMERWDEKKRMAERILFVEEHPFTVLDWKDYHFQIHVIKL